MFGVVLFVMINLHMRIIRLAFLFVHSLYFVYFDQV